MYRALIVGLALLLAGCASGGLTGKEALTLAPEPQKARLVIYRTAIYGMAVQPSYIVNGKPVAPAQPSGFVVCDLTPGPHAVTVDNPSINVNFGGGTDKVDVNLKPGETQFIRADMNMGLTMGVVTLTEVKEKVGRAETEGLSKQVGRCPSGVAEPATVANGATPAQKSPARETGSGTGAGTTKVAGGTTPRPGRGGDCADYMFNGQSCTDARGSTCTVAGGRRVCSNPGGNAGGD